MYAFTLCMWIKSSASPGIGTPFSYGVPGQANEIVLIEWGNNPIELLINDKASSFWFPKSTKSLWLYDKKYNLHSLYWATLLLMGFYVSQPQLHAHCILTTGCPVAFGGTRWKVAPHLHLLDHTGRPMGGLPRWREAGNRRQPGCLAPHQTRGRHHPGAGAGKEDPKIWEETNDQTVSDARLCLLF